MFQKWWVVLIQGILLIALSIIILNNPGGVLLTISLWLGIVVLLAGLFGVIAYYVGDKEKRDVSSLVWSILITIVGFLLLIENVFTMKAITIVFGIIVATVGLILFVSGWHSKTQSDKWWILALLGVIIFITGISSMFNLSSGAESISFLLGISVLLAGLGLTTLAFWKKRFLNLIEKSIKETN
jgi:uncharacterized membrane protein HdeD (DUF308 family)